MKTRAYPWEETFYDPWLFDCGAGNSDQDNTVDNYVAIINKEHPKRILDIGCGTGRLSFALAEKGHIVHGIDMSPSMLAAFARRKEEEGGLYENVTYEQKDILNANRSSWKSGFDVVIAADDFLTHFLNTSDLMRCLRTVENCLRPNGIFITDLRGRDSQRMREASKAFPKLPYCYPVVDGGKINNVDVYISMMEFEDYDVDDGIITSIQKFEYITHSGKVIDAEYKTIRQKLYSVEDVITCARDTGLLKSEIVGRKELGESCSILDGAILILQKGEE